MKNKKWGIGQLDKSLLLIALILAIIVFVVSIYLFPEWKGKWWLLTVVVIVGVVNFIANFRQAFEKNKDMPTEKQVIIGSSQIAMGDHGRNIQAQTNIEKEEINHPGNVVIGTQYQNIYQDITPRQVAEDEVKAAQDRLKALPLRNIPQPSVLPKGSRFPNIRPNPLFVGREEELGHLAELLKGKSAVAIGQVEAITGMGGIGKTQLASEFAHRYGRFFAGGVFWLNFAEPELVPSEVAACGTPGNEAPLEAQVKQVLSEWQSELPRLLIFDNCEDPRLLVQWLPVTGASRVLVTSRQSNWDPALGVEPLPLGLLERSESISLLKSFCDDLEADDAGLAAIAAELGDLPLALHMAGSFLRTYRHEMSPEKYLEVLRQPGLLEHISLKKGEFSPTGHDLNVGRTFAIGVEKLKKKNKIDRLALMLLIRVACFAPGALIPRELLKASMGQDIGDIPFAEGIERLLELGLVEETRAGDVRMHRLVSCYILDTLEHGEALEGVEQVVIRAASDTNLSGYPARMELVLAHLQHLTGKASERADERAALLANEMGYYLQMTADYAGTRPYYEQALAIRRKVLGEQHPATALSLNNLGYLLQAKGDYAGARPYYEQALAIRRKVLGEEHPDTAASLNNLGMLLQAMGDYSGTRPYLEQALAIRRKVLGEEHPYTAQSLNNLGHLLRAMGHNVGARPYYEQALAINRKVLGEEHPYTALSLNNMGYLLQAMGDYSGARPYYEQALAIKRKVLGEEHPDTASSLNNLGSLLQEMGDSAGARPNYEQALAIFRKTFGPDHPTTKIVRGNLESLGKR